jgi:hypothetical protein
MMIPRCQNVNAPTQWRGQCNHCFSAWKHSFFLEWGSEACGKNMREHQVRIRQSNRRVKHKIFARSRISIWTKMRPKDIKYQAECAIGGDHARAFDSGSVGLGISFVSAKAAFSAVSLSVRSVSRRTCLQEHVAHRVLRSVDQSVTGVRTPINAPQFLHHKTIQSPLFDDNA